jgi:hypothetical protein
MNFNQLFGKFKSLSRQDTWPRWWLVTIIQVVASLIAAPLAIGLLSQLP